jgi:hypothetical protein
MILACSSKLSSGWLILMDAHEDWPKRFRIRAFPGMDVFEHIRWLNDQVRELGLQEPNDDTFVRKWVGRKPRKEDSPSE